MNAILVPMQLQSCFGSFLHIPLFSAGEIPSLVKNVEVEFKIKPPHAISKGNMSVDQAYLIHCSWMSL